MNRWFALLAVAPILFFNSGCGEKLGDYIVRMTPEYDVLRERLAEAAALIPESTTETVAPASPPDPPMLFDETVEGPTNTDFLMFHHLTDPYYDYPEQESIDLLLSKNLLRILEWTGDDSPLVESGRKRKIDKSDTRDFEGTLATRYVAVAKVEEYNPLVAIGPNTYQGGNAVLSGHLIDLSEKKLLGSFVIEATPATEVTYSYEDNKGDPQQRMVTFARSMMYTALREKFAAAMEATFGGEFNLR